MLRISVAVMAHPKRHMQAEYLAAILKLYPFANVSIVYDELSNEWHTGSRAMQNGVGKGDWHLVIQDDAVLMPELFANIEQLIYSLPEKSVVSLYCGKVKPLAERVQLAVDKASYGDLLNFYMLLWGVAVLIPTDHIEPMLEFVGGAEYDETQYDSRIGVFYQRNRMPIYFTTPSLVDHDDDMGSLLDGHQTTEPRVAHKLATGLVAWTGNVVNI